MKARNRPHLIVIEARGVTGQDGYGHDIEGWAEFAREYAAVYFGTGREQREAAQASASQAASFEVLSNSKTRAVSVTDHRITFDGGIWNITGKQPLGLNQGVRLTAVRVVA